MLNLFDLSAGMANTKVLSDQAHRDGSPVCRSWQDIKRITDPTKVSLEDEPGSTIRSSTSNKSNALPKKMLVSKKMPKEVELKRKPPSVVAKLMGLEDDLPAQEPATHYAKRNMRKNHSTDNLEASIRPQQQQKQHHHRKTTGHVHISPNETVEFKDVYAVCEEPLRIHHLHDQTFPMGRSSGEKSDIRMEVVRQKFIEAKRLATDENLLHTKEFQEALEVLSSNKDLFLKFLEEPSSAFLKQPNEHHTEPTSSQSKRITVLKPLKSVEKKGVRKNRMNRVNEDIDFLMRKTHQRSHSAEGNFSQPTRIVVLKPSPGKPSRTQTNLTPHAVMYELTGRTDIPQSLDGDASTQGYRHGLVQYLPEGRLQRDESSLSSAYSNVYGADESSFDRSEADYIDEDGDSLSDSEVVSPVSRHSWDYIKRYNSPYSGSAYTRASHSHSPESSVIKETKKQLSGRWTNVAYNENSQEARLPRKSRTLGDMLSLREDKKEEIIVVVNSASSKQSCDTENEFAMQDASISPLREDENVKSSRSTLARSKSLPVSSLVFHNITMNPQSAKSESGNTSMVKKPSKGKLSLKGKVSSFFFSRSKRLTKEKPTLPFNISDDRIEVISLGDMQSETDNGINIDQQMSFHKDVADNSTIQTIHSSKDVCVVELPVSSDCPSGYIDGLRLKGGLKCIHEQPSPTSILDASFEDNNSIEPESSRSITSRNEIESISRSLSWEVTNSRSLLEGSSAEDDELESYALVQNIVSSAGLDNLELSMIFTGWYLPDCPLDPSLCDKFLDRKEEVAKSRERRSNQKLIFNCVNMSIIEISEDAILSTYPWRKACLLAWREPLSQSLGEEVWSHVRGWLYGAERFVANENDDAATMLERIMQQEMEGRGWIKSTRSAFDEIIEQIASVVLEELVREGVDDLSVCFP